MKHIRNRRHLLQAAGSLAALAGLAPRLGNAVSENRELSFHHLHTGESLRIAYAERGRYLPEALAAIDHLLRDFRTGEVHAIDPRLLDILHQVATRVGSSGTYDIISGYRSPTTNTSLRRKSEGVALRSMHLVGQAVDVRLRDTRTADVRRAALALRAGGVGYYADSDFVHLDTGRVRSW